MSNAMVVNVCPGARSTYDISIDFEMKWKFVMFLFIENSADHNKILLCTRHHSVTVVMCAKFRCDWLSTL